MDPKKSLLNGKEEGEKKEKRFLASASFGLLLEAGSKRKPNRSAAAARAVVFARGHQE